MHSFHRSRARIFFEVVCVLGIAASCVAAWMQTYAPAMLAIAGFAGLYGLVHALDMVRRRPAVAATVEPPAPMTDDRGDLLVYVEPDEPELQLDAESQVAEVAQEMQSEVVESIPEIEPEVVKPPQPEPVADIAEEEEAEPKAPEPVQDVTPIEPVHEEPEYSPVAPLFEAEPFVRKPRAAFGRKAG
jgi:hypothetical protein